MKHLFLDTNIYATIYIYPTQYTKNVYQSTYIDWIVGTKIITSQFIGGLLPPSDNS